MHLALDHHLEQSPAVRAGRPCIVGTRITVDDVVILHQRLAQSLDEIAAVYDLPLSALYAAMSYYHDHKDEIDRRIDEDDAYVEAQRLSAPSKLQARLKAFRGASCSFTPS